jgi:putative addiction module component (TIGR02574 family)
MSISLREIESVAVALSPEDRAHLAQVLLESLQEPHLNQIEAAWEDEITKRIAAWKGGQTQVYAATDVLAEARRACR